MSSRVKSLLINLTLIVSAFAVTGGLCELGVRLFYPQPTALSHQDKYGLVMHWPGIVRKVPQFGTHDVSFNSAGMRDREHTVEKEPGVFRILVLGDSFMEAYQVPFESSLPSLLEHNLAQATGKKIEVINAGVSGWGTDDELRYLKLYGVKWRPDLVVVAMTLHNDILDNLRRTWHTLSGDTLIARDVTPMSYRRYKIVELKSFLAVHLETYQLWAKVRHGSEIRSAGKQLNNHIVELFRKPTPDTIALGFRLTELELAAIQREVQPFGGRVAVMMLPLKVQLSDKIFADFVRECGVTLNDMDITTPQRTVTQSATKLGIPVVDLLPAFQKWTADAGPSLYMATDGHWNQAGHKLAAETLAAGLVQSAAVR